MRKNYPRLLQQSSRIERKIDSLAGAPERKINETIFNQLSSYSGNLGNVQLKGQIFEISIEVEKAISHGKICQMVLPSGPLGTELGDIIIAVDHVLDDAQLSNQKRKVIGGTCSIIQTKKENLAKKGLPARQLYLMTQWPRFRYNRQYWEFRLQLDVSSFYLFVLDPSSHERKTNLFSSILLCRLLGVNKTSLLNNIRADIPLPSLDVIRRENADVLPFSLTSFLIRSLYLSLGSQSVDFRDFLRNAFFPSMEEIEDCVSTTQTECQWQAGDYVPFYSGSSSKGEDEDIYAVRFKVIIKRID